MGSPTDIDIPAELHTPPGAAAPQRAVRNPELKQLLESVDRLVRDARELGDALQERLAEEDSNPEETGGQPVDRRGNDPRFQCQRAAACRAAGLYDRAVHHAVRAAESLRAAGCSSEARDVLEESTSGLENLGPDSLELLSESWERLALNSRAAEAAAQAAELHRLAGRFELALALCRRSSSLDREVAGLHQIWGLTLLALDEPESALGHLARWMREDGDQPAARIWYTQALFETGAREEAMTSIHQLARDLQVPVGDSLPIHGLGSRVAESLGHGGTLAAHEPEAPFWEIEGICGKLDPALARNGGGARREADDATGSSAPRKPAEASGLETRPRPRVFLAQDLRFQRLKLSEILTAEDIEVLRCSAVEGILERIAREVLRIDLIILPVFAGRDSNLDLIAKIREIPGMADVPMLGVIPLDRTGLDFDKLRLLGMVGLIHSNAIPEHVAFRVNSVVRKHTPEGRRFDRAPTYFAVDLEAEGRVSCEYATNLSCGGLQIASTRALPSGTEVRIRFHPPSADGRLIEARGTVVWTGRANRPGAPPHRLGIFFDELDPQDRDLIASEVQKILSLPEW